MLGSGKKQLGCHWTFNLWNDPKRPGFVLSRYKFAAKMACRGRRVLELGCSEGIGAPILAEHATAIHRRWTRRAGDRGGAAQLDRMRASTFIAGDFLGKPLGDFDAVVSLDVVEHIQPDAADAVLRRDRGQSRRRRGRGDRHAQRHLGGPTRPAASGAGT